VDFPELVSYFYGEPREPSTYCEEDVAIEPAPTSTSIGTINTNPPVASQDVAIEPAPTSTSIGTIYTNPPVASPNNVKPTQSTNDAPTPAASPTSGMVAVLTNDTSTSELSNRRSITLPLIILITLVAMK
jgi:hypothetical protein